MENNFSSKLLLLFKNLMLLGLVIYLGYGVKNSKVNPLNTKAEDIKQTEDIELTESESPQVIVNS